MKILGKLFLLLISAYLAGCSANASDDPNDVAIGHHGHIPAGCHFRGNVSVLRKDINGGPAPAITEDELNQLRTQTASLGGNYVLLTGKTDYYYDEYLIEPAKVVSELEAQHLEGRAYWCPGRR